MGTEARVHRLASAELLRALVGVPLAALAIGCASSGKDAALLQASSAPVGHFERSPSSIAERPEIESARLEVKTLALREAAIEVQVTLAAPDVPGCELRAMHLKWFLDDAPFAASSHALSGECLSADHGSAGIITVASEVSYLGLPAASLGAGVGIFRRLQNSQVSVQGEITAEVSGERVPLYFSASAPPGQGVAQMLLRLRR